MWTVRLDPNVTYGAVEIWTENGYQLVCADGFDDFAAKVICRAGGFQHGISVCCSAFGDLEYEIGYQDFKCRGDEISILKCPHRFQHVDCPSQKYASVACSNKPASGRKYFITFHSRESNNHYTGLFCQFLNHLITVHSFSTSNKTTYNCALFN